MHSLLIVECKHVSFPPAKRHRSLVAGNEEQIKNSNPQTNKKEWLMGT
jgi:hypothetical protein